MCLCNGSSACLCAWTAVYDASWLRWHVSGCECVEAHDRSMQSEGLLALAKKVLAVRKDFARGIVWNAGLLRLLKQRFV
jgi:hypothetical protein